MRDIHGSRRGGPGERCRDCGERHGRDEECELTRPAPADSEDDGEDDEQGGQGGKCGDD